MRVPFEDVLPVEPVAQGRLAIILSAACVLNFGAVYLLSMFLTFDYIGKCDIREDCENIELIAVMPGHEVLAFFLFLVAFANASVAKIILVLVDSAEMRVLLRCALQVAVWAFCLPMIRLIWGVFNTLLFL